MLLFVLLSEWWVNMSLLQAIKEAKAVVSSLEALLGTEVQDEPWYENIPAGGVLCWRSDCMEDLYNQMRDAARGDACLIYYYNADNNYPFQHYCEWKYAIPVDPDLRLPNGAITS
jgi:hypothetical protein